MERKAKPAASMAQDMQPSNKLYGNKGKTYAEISAALKGDSISNAVAMQRAALERAWERGKVKLSDETEVKAGISEYLAACELAHVVPTFLGLAASFGLSRARIYAFCAANPSSETAQAIDAFRTASAAVMAEGSLTRSLDAATSIFLMKNSGQNLQDKHEFEVQAQPVTNSTDPHIVGTVEPYLRENGVDYSSMDDDAKTKAYINLRYGGEEAFHEYLEQIIVDD